MKNSIKNYNKWAAILLFFALPILIYVLSDFPRRSILKETISILTLGAFFVTMLQFFMSRAAKDKLKEHRMATVIKWHKVLGYIVAGILLLHPFLIIAPRFFEAGILPQDAFIELITTSTQGVILGIITWMLMLLIALTSIFRDKLGIRYKVWRMLHGILSITFITGAAFHVIELGRHINIPMLWLISVLSILAVALLLKLYFFKTSIKA